MNFNVSRSDWLSDFFTVTNKTYLTRLQGCDDGVVVFKDFESSFRTWHLNQRYFSIKNGFLWAENYEFHPVLL